MHRRFRRPRCAVVDGECVGDGWSAAAADRRICYPRWWSFGPTRVWKGQAADKNGIRDGKAMRGRVGEDGWTRWTRFGRQEATRGFSMGKQSEAGSPVLLDFNFRGFGFCETRGLLSGKS